MAATSAAIMPKAQGAITGASTGAGGATAPARAELLTDDQSRRNEQGFRELIFHLFSPEGTGIQPRVRRMSLQKFCNTSPAYRTYMVRTCHLIAPISPNGQSVWL